MESAVSEGRCLLRFALSPSLRAPVRLSTSHARHISAVALCFSADSASFWSLKRTVRERQSIIHISLNRTRINDDQITLSPQAISPGERRRHQSSSTTPMATAIAK